MPIYDSDSTAERQIASVYDSDSAAERQIASVYDSDSTTERLIYQNSWELYNSGTFNNFSNSARTSCDNTNFTYSYESNCIRIYNPASDVAGVWCLTTYIDMSKYSTCKVSFWNTMTSHQSWTGPQNEVYVGFKASAINASISAGTNIATPWIANYKITAVSDPPTPISGTGTINVSSLSGGYFWAQLKAGNTEMYITSIIFE